MSFVKQIREWLDHLRGKGPAAAVALSLDLGEARDNKPFMLEAGGLIVESCDGDLYARINGPNGDGLNLRYTTKILYPLSSLYLTNTAQAGRSARILLLPAGMEVDPARLPTAWSEETLAAGAWWTCPTGTYEVFVYLVPGDAAFDTNMNILAENYSVDTALWAPANHAVTPDSTFVPYTVSYSRCSHGWILTTGERVRVMTAWRIRYRRIG